MSTEQYEQDSELYLRYVSYKSDIDKQLKVVDKEIEAVRNDIEELEVCKTELDEDEISIINEEIASKSSSLKDFLDKKDTLLNNPALSMLVSTCRSNVMLHVGKFREKNYLNDDKIKNFYSTALDVYEITEDDIRMHEQITNLEKETKKRTLGEASSSIPFKELKHIKYALTDDGRRIDLSGIKVFSVRFGRTRDITKLVNVTPKKKNHNKMSNFSHHMFGQTPIQIPVPEKTGYGEREQKANTVWNGFSRDSMKSETTENKIAESNATTTLATKVTESEKQASVGKKWECSKKRTSGGTGGGNKQAPKKSSNPYERLR